MSFDNIPIITLNLERMRHTVKMALLQHADQVNQEIQAAVDRFCVEDNLRAILDQQARACIKQVMEEEVKNFFSWNGAGREVVRSAVLKRLKETYDPTAE